MPKIIQDPPFTIRLGNKLTDALDAMGTKKNEFVRQAIRRALREVCPRCKGVGFIKKGRSK